MPNDIYETPTSGHGKRVRNGPLSEMRWIGTGPEMVNIGRGSTKEGGGVEERSIGQDLFVLLIGWY